MVEKKPSKWMKLKVEILGWLFLIGLFASIWIPEYRWRLLFSSLIFLIWAFVAVWADREKEKKSKTKNLNKTGEKKD